MGDGFKISSNLMYFFDLLIFLKFKKNDEYSILMNSIVL